MLLLGLSFIFSMILLIEVPGLISKKYWWELVVFLFLSLAAFTISALLTLGFHLPSPVKIIQFVIDYVFELLKSVNFSFKI